jgi:hypothetical protein
MLQLQASYTLGFSYTRQNKFAAEKTRHQKPYLLKVFVLTIANTIC